VIRLKDLNLFDYQNHGPQATLTRLGSAAFSSTRTRTATRTIIASPEPETRNL